MSTYQRAAAFRSSEAVVSPVRLLVMLYDRLIRDLDDAADSIRTGDRASASFALVHAQEIVTELETALDPDAWDAAAELSSIYVYLQARLVRANLHQDLQAIHDCRVATDPLREAWTKIWQDEAAKVVRPAPQSEGHLAFDAVG